MASSQAKIGWQIPRKRENKNYRSVHSIPTRHEIENSKRIAKKFKNIIMASFQAKIDWKMPRKREYKNYRYVSFPSDA